MPGSRRRLYHPSEGELGTDGVVPRGTRAPIGASRLLDQARQFITLNRDVLLDYWDYKIDTDELRQRLKSIDL